MLAIAANEAAVLPFVDGRHHVPHRVRQAVEEAAQAAAAVHPAALARRDAAQQVLDHRRCLEGGGGGPRPCLSRCCRSFA